MSRPVDDTRMWKAYNEERILNEAQVAYEAGLISKDQLIKEGIWDRMKARGAGAVGSAKGLGQRVAGKVAGVSGVLSGNKATVDAGMQQAAAASGKGMDAKALSIANSHMAKIEKAINAFQTDMSKLGLDPKSMQASNPEAAAALQALSGALNNLKSRLQPTGQVGKAVGNVGQQPTAPAVA